MIFKEIYRIVLDFEILLHKMVIIVLLELFLVLLVYIEAF